MKTTFLLIIRYRISSDLSEKAALDLLISKDRYDKRLLPPSKGKLAICTFCFS